MPLKTVVLSACDTAQGGLDYSEGIFGHSTQPVGRFPSSRLMMTAAFVMS
jgi:hypothetical protein